MTNEERIFEEVDSDGQPLRVGECYEVVYGPASSPERTGRGVLREFNSEAKTYTFQLEDGTEATLVGDELDGVRHVGQGC